MKFVQGEDHLETVALMEG